VHPCGSCAEALSREREPIQPPPPTPRSGIPGRYLASPCRYPSLIRVQPPAAPTWPGGSSRN